MNSSSSKSTEALKSTNDMIDRFDERFCSNNDNNIQKISRENFRGTCESRFYKIFQLANSPA